MALLPQPARIAIDGVDAAGKTTLADELAEALRSRRVDVTRVCADDFIRPPAERYRRGRESPEGYYLDSFDHERLRRAARSGAGVTIVDGIFLLRPELNDLWDFRVLVDIDLDESIRRGAARDAAWHGSHETAEHFYRWRYAPAQRLYFERVRPHELADVVVDNADPGRPRLSQRKGLIPPTA